MPDDQLTKQLAQTRREAEEREAKRLAEKLRIEYLDIGKAPIQIEALKYVPEADAKRLQVAPFQYKNKVMALAAVNPEQPELKKLLASFKEQGITVKVFVGSLSGLMHAWDYYRFVPKQMGDVSGRVVIDKARFAMLFEKLLDLKKVADEVKNFDFKNQPTTNLIEVIMAGALRNRASDIHFEAERDGARLRYRVDGALHDVVPDFSPKLYPFLVSRIKLLSNLKLNVKDAPQDGRFSVELAEREIELRVSLIPSEFGETIVMRVLDPLSLKSDITELGLRKDDLEIVNEEINRPNGMLLNTGPTGSGKTTTLYTFLLSRRNPEIKIITIEDPIEYHLESIEQTQTDPEAGYTFADGLRSMMRQDPDVILVGEIRDKETGEIAVQAALTGHLVFSTIHANSAAGAVPRLLDLGVKAVSIAPALNLAIAQRLVRRLCEKCKQPEKVTDEMKKNLAKFFDKLPGRVDRAEFKDIKLFKPKGCPECNNLGYRGRIAIFELLRLTKEIQDLVTPDVSTQKMQEAALKQGMVTLQQDGVLKVISGITTFEEVIEVTGQIEW